MLWASVLCWVVYAGVQIYGFIGPPFHMGGYGRQLVSVLFGLAIVASVAAWLGGGQ